MTDMIPRQYYHKDETELSDYIDNSMINEKLFEGYLEVKSTYYGGPRVIHPLLLFNEAYYYAAKVNMDQYPELDINRDYLDDFMTHHPDELSRDIVFCFVFVILKSMEHPPKKVIRFCNLLGQKYEWYDEHLHEIASVLDLLANHDHSDLYLKPYFMQDPFCAYDEINWHDATDGFQWHYIKYYVEQGWNLRDKIYILDCINKQFLNFEPMKDNWFSTTVADKIRDYAFTLNYQKDLLKEKKPEEFNDLFPDEDYTETASDRPSNKQDNTSTIVSDTEEKRLPDDEKTRLYENISGLKEQIIIKDSEIQRLNETLSDILSHSSDIETVDRTRPVVSAVLFEMIKLARGERHGANINQTKSAKIISYLTGFSYNTIRQGLSKTTRNAENIKEVNSIIALLNELNIKITID